MGFFDLFKTFKTAKKAMDKSEGRTTTSSSGAVVHAQDIAAAVRNAGYNIDDFSVDVNGSIATVYGSVSSAEDRNAVILAVNGMRGIQGVDDRISVLESAPSSHSSSTSSASSGAAAGFYVVQKGDSLSKIAKAHYGDPMKYMTIFEANSDLLSDPNKIYPGQKLRIPQL